MTPNKFSKDMVVKVLDSGLVQLVKPFYFYSSKNSEDVVTVPEGFISDFASVPFLLRSFISPIGRYSKPAVLHDYLCDLKQFKKADKWFLDAMTVSKVNFFQKWLIYFSVRIYHLIRYWE